MPLYGSSGDDRLTGDQYSDRIWGGAGNDQIFGGDIGDDYLWGEEGDDLIVSGLRNVSYLNGGAGNDDLQAYYRSTMLGGAGNDNLRLGQGIFYFDDDIQTATGGLGADTFHVSPASTWSQADRITDFILEEGDLLALMGVVNGRVVPTDEYQWGNAERRVIFAGELDPGQSFFYGSTLPILTEVPVIHVWFCNVNGYTVLIADSNGVFDPDDLVVTLTDSLELTASNFVAGTFDASLALPNTIRGSGYSDALTGTSVRDFMTGLSANDTLAGLDGNDLIYGGDGNDTLDGGAGADLMAGERGNDYYVIDTALDRAVEVLGQGYDTAFTTVSFVIEFNSEIEALRVSEVAGTASLDLTGNDYAQILSGNDGSNGLLGLGGDDYLEGRGGVDTLNGGTGGDTMRGGTGDDYYIVDNSGDRMLEGAGEGFDTVFASASVSIEAGSEVEALRAADAASTAALNLWGNEHNQVIAGNAGANGLFGMGGDDYLEGRAGSDTLDGGSGADTLIGGTGDDYYVVDDKFDRVIENAGEGFDTIFSSSITYSLDAGLSIEAIRADETPGSALILAGNELGQILAGNNGDNRIYGFGGDDYLEGRGGVDTLDGGMGGDTMRGGTGDDYYIIDNTGDRILESAGEGFDTAFVDASFSLEAGMEVEALRASNAASTARMDLWGNEFGQVIQGTAGVNLLVGYGGDDYLEARGGDDKLDGGSGNDVLIGGTGVDIFAFGEIGFSDRIIDFVSGTDRIDLRGIDAVSTAPDDQAFTWVGANAFTNVAGQLRSYSSGGVNYLAGDVDGNGIADFLIDVGSSQVVTGDILS